MIIRIKDNIFRVLYLLIILYLLIFIPILWGYKPLVVISGSMEPVLKVGGILYYKDIDINDYRVDDILVYKLDNHNISHRITRIINNSFITKGDTNDIEDNLLVNQNQILGKGTNWCIPYIGYYADFIYNHKYLLFISVTLVILDLCNDIYREHKKKVRKHDKDIN